MTIKIAFFLSSCLCISSCFLNYPSCQDAYLQAFEITVKVMDKHGKPVANKKVLAIKDTREFNVLSDISGNKSVIAEAITDNTGKAILTYQLNHNCDFAEYGIITVKGDASASFQPVNVITHKNNETPTVKDSIKLSGTIWMDSLVPFQLRIKSNKNNVDTLVLAIYSGGGSENSRIARQFNRTLDIRYPSLLDTIVSIEVYSKATFSISNSIRCRDGSNINGKNHVIDSTVNRNLIFLDEIN